MLNTKISAAVAAALTPAAVRRQRALFGAALAMAALPMLAHGDERLPEPRSAADQKLEDVVVTGSRLVTNGNDMPTPVTVVTAAELQATAPAGTIFDQINQLPAFFATMGAQVPSGFNADANTGVSALNLRGLGGQRVLTLFDGHRVPPSTPDGYTNVNLMPSMLMQRVDVVTGGASAIYGSDAVSGVVNFILDHKFNGVKFEAQGSESAKSDDRGYRFGLAAGTNLFDGRGHIEASFTRTQNDGLPWISQSRPGMYNYTVQGQGTAASPYQIVQGATAGFATAGGLIQNGPLAGYSFDQNGVPTLANQAVDGYSNQSVWALAASRIDQGFMRVDFDVNDQMHLYADVGVNRDNEYGGFSPGVDGGMTFGACNAFLSAALQATLGCTNQNDPNQPTFVVNKIPVPFINNLKTTLSNSTMENGNLLAGVQGTFGNGYHYDTSVTLAQTSQYVQAIGVDHDPPWFAAMDAVVDPATGNIVCNVTLTNPGLYPGCVPINMFGPSSESAAALNYTFGTIWRRSLNRTKEWQGSISGSPMNGWAGPIQMALSADVRRNDLSDTTNSTQDYQSCVGQRFGNCQPGGTHTWGNTIIPIPGVSQTAYEGAFEFSMPLLKDLPFVKALSTDNAYRFTHYENNGYTSDSSGNSQAISTGTNASNWKVGLVWDMSDVLTARLARSRDMRAPNLWDLFQPVNYQPFSFGTPDYLCSADKAVVAAGTCNPLPINNGNGAPTVLSGNPYLKPETGNTTTLGLIYRPTKDLSFTVDLYDIQVKDYITYLNGYDTAVQQACYNSGGSSPTCALQVRTAGNFNYSPTNTVAMWYTRPVNLSNLTTRGADFEVDYATQVAGHAVSVRALATYMNELSFSEPGLTQTFNVAGTNGQAFGFFADPKLRAQMFVHANVAQGFDVDLAERWRSGMRLQYDPTKVEVGSISSVAYTNLTATYTLQHIPKISEVKLFLNVQNLFDTAPPHAGSINPGLPGGSGDGWVLGDDTIGRYFTVGVRGRF